MDKKVDGLGMTRILKFNRDLLGKWCWRIKVDQYSLLFNVLVAKYGHEDGRVKEGGRWGSSWWKEVVGIWRDVGLGVGSWFEDNLVWVVSDGTVM